MRTASAHRARAVRRLAALGALGLCVVAAGASTALAGPAAKPAAAHAGKTITLRYYSVVVSLVYTGPDGTVVPHPPQSPEVGGQLEIFELAYKGTHASHSRKWTATSHTTCVFKSAKGAPTCDGQAAVGGNQMLLFHTPAGGAPAVSGGTGRFAGATGGVTSADIGDTNNSDVVITVHLGK